jgi:hypothetical protein
VLTAHNTGHEVEYKVAQRRPPAPAQCHLSNGVFPDTTKPLPCQSCNLQVCPLLLLRQAVV